MKHLWLNLMFFYDLLVLFKSPLCRTMLMEVRSALAMLFWPYKNAAMVPKGKIMNRESQRAETFKPWPCTNKKSSSSSLNRGDDNTGSMGSPSKLTLQNITMRQDLTTFHGFR